MRLQRKKLKVVSMVVVCLMVMNVFSASFVIANVDSQKAGETIETIESFQIKTTEKNKEGFYEQTGYKNVNSITTIVQTFNSISTVQEVIEDYYNIDGGYIKTLAKKIIYKNNFETGVAKESVTEKALEKPATIKPENNDLGTLSNEEDVKKNVKSFTESLAIAYNEAQGITNEELQKIQDEVKDFKENYKISIDSEAPSGQKIIIQSCSDKRCAGAFDNYYNYFYTSGVAYE